MNVYEKVEKNINDLVENNVYWSACAGAEVTVFDLSERMLSFFKKRRRIYHDGTKSD